LAGNAYLDFVIEIGKGEGREYPLSVVFSPAGEARAVMRFPFDQLALENHLLRLEKALLKSGGKRRQVLSPDQEAVRAFGTALFEALFSGEARNRYDVSLERARQAESGLRIKLRIQDARLAALPWEFLFDPRQGDYLCLSNRTPLVRYLELPQPPQPLAVRPPLRILGLVASPSDLPALDVDCEKQRVEAAIEGLRAAGKVELTWLESPTWRDLQRALRRGPWHIFHFIGHGGYDPAGDQGLVALCDENGKKFPLNAGDLGRLLANHPTLRLALLNACDGARGGETDIFSSTASILVRSGLPAVAAMQYEITDAAAIEFSRSFYEALADGLPVDAAVSEARLAVNLGVHNSLEWGTPVLYLRAPNGALFALQKPPAQPAQPAQPPVVIHSDGGTVLVGDVHTAGGDFVGRDKIEQPDDSRTQAALKLAKGELQRLARKLKERNKQAVGERALQALEQARQLQQGRVTLRLPGDIPLELLRIPPGSFPMGSDKERDPSADNAELPLHNVYLDEYWIGRYPLTNRQYAAFVQAAGYPPPEHWENGRIPAGKEEHPVVYVSWEDAAAFCRWATQTLGRSLHLPSEAEWEKAARGTDGRIYPWGDQAPDRQLANFNQNEKGTTPVGRYSPQGDSPYGCADMAGNVWQWVQDWYSRDYYQTSPERNPTGPTSGKYKVVRGGSWLNYAGNIRSPYRLDPEPDNRYNVFGFRCVVSAEK